MRRFLYPVLISAVVVLAGYYVVMPRYPDLGMVILLPGVVVSAICGLFDSSGGISGPFDKYPALMLAGCFVFYCGLIPFFLGKVRKLKASRATGGDQGAETGAGARDPGTVTAADRSGDDPK